MRWERLQFWIRRPASNVDVEAGSQVSSGVPQGDPIRFASQCWAEQDGQVSSGVPNRDQVSSGVPGAEVSSGVPEAQVSSGVPGAQVSSGVPEVTQLWASASNIVDVDNDEMYVEHAKSEIFLKL